MIYIQLFLSFLQIGLFSFGGGYAALPLIENQVVESNQWLSVAEFSDLVTISQMTPGPIAINTATFVGTKIAGMGGAIVATLGCILPSCIIVSFLTFIYLKYRKLDVIKSTLATLRPAVIALIASAGLSILISAFWGVGEISVMNTNINAVILFSLSMFLLLKKNIDPIQVMLLAGICNVVMSSITQIVMI